MANSKTFVLMLFIHTIKPSSFIFLKSSGSGKTPMAARKHSDDIKFCSIEKQQFVIFDCSNHFIRAFCSRPEHHYGKFDRLKRVAVHDLENTRARKRTKSLILDTVIDDSVLCDEDSDVKSDAESLPCSQRDVATDVSDDEQSVNNLIHDEGTRKKLKLLAGIVGADSMEPGNLYGSGFPFDKRIYSDKGVHLKELEAMLQSSGFKST